MLEFDIYTCLALAAEELNKQQLNRKEQKVKRKQTTWSEKGDTRSHESSGACWGTAFLTLSV
jgi:hypothetical protein